jgi:hypothetical protein
MHWRILRALSPSFTVKREIPVLSHPPNSPDLSPTDFFVSKIKNCDEKSKIQGCFMDPTDCDERIEGDMGRSVFSGIRFFV